ncbi:MAG: hypothetical protein ACRDHO_09020 [Actinomycetota bacterium]
MEVLTTAINAAVVGAVGLILAWLGKGRFEAMDVKIERLERRLEHRIEQLEQRLDHRIVGLEHRMDRFEVALDTMRSDLTQVALAVGVDRRANNA